MKTRFNAGEVMVFRFSKYRILLPLSILLIFIATPFLVINVSSRSTRVKTVGSYDVVVVGAGPGGVAASIQAARMGARVALLESTSWIGGQMTAAGVGTMDEGNIAARQSGIYHDFVSRTLAFYQSRHKSVDTCYFDTESLCVDPAVGQTILRQMLQESGTNVSVFDNTTVTSIKKSGSTVTGVIAGEKMFNAKVVIDADEYGDVLDLAGANYRLGDGTAASQDSRSCVQSITYSAVIKRYSSGVPADLQFKRPPPGYNKSIATHFAAYVRGHNTVDNASRSLRDLSFERYVAFRGLPDLSNPYDYNVTQTGHTITRTLLNLGNDYPASGDLSARYISDKAYRAEVNCQAKLLTLQFIYYIQHDLGETNWSIANDEGYDTAYNRSQHCATLSGWEAFENELPVEPYVREARRLVGVQTLTGNELAQSISTPAAAVRFPQSIAVGYYPMDLHACHEPLETAFDSPNDLRQKFTGGAFEVSIGTLIPLSTDGLLAVEQNVSASREANGALREQPIAMATGQAAGALAALAVQEHTQPRNVPYSDVQKVLQESGAVTSH